MSIVTRRVAWRSLLVFGLAMALSLAPTSNSITQAQTDAAEPFMKLKGWWIGQGRLGFKGGKTEMVKCRATYRFKDGAQPLIQTVRCVSTSGKVELKSELTHKDGVLSGTWSERYYNFKGDLHGEVIENGFRVDVAGDDLKANMTILVKDTRQIVEIEFFDSAIIRLTLILGRRS